MSTLKERLAIASQVAEAMGKKVYNDVEHDLKEVTPRMELQQKSPKLVTLEEAIRRSGLRDGMTISFHHHFRGGDKVVNMVVDKLAAMGFKDLHLAASSLQDVHAYTAYQERRYHTGVYIWLAWRTGQRDFARTDGEARCVPLARQPWRRHRFRRVAH